MRRAAALAAAAAALLLPGCSDVVGERPEAWQAGEPLWAYAGGKAHNADEGFLLHARNATAAPARCVAYQEGRQHEADSCSVVAAAEAWREPPSGSPWVLAAQWDGAGERLHEDVELHPERRTVVAFAADGTVAAWWDGLRRESPGAFFTE
jgi:hypothetical protein